MLRFRCPACNKTLKVPAALAGKKVCCPRCHGAAQSPALEPNRERQVETPGFAHPISARVWLVLVLAVIAAVIGLLSVALPPLLGWRAVGWGWPLAWCSILAVLAVLHGHGTGCPACGAWWSRRTVRSEMADREVLEHDGMTFVKSKTRTEFRCDKCKHGWSVADAEEFPMAAQAHARNLRR